MANMHLKVNDLLRRFWMAIWSYSLKLQMCFY